MPEDYDLCFCVFAFLGVWYLRFGTFYSASHSPIPDYLFLVIVLVVLISI